MHRLGVLPGPGAGDLAERIAALDGLELAGVFAHEGHVYTQARDDAERERMTLRVLPCSAVETAEEIRARGLPAPVVSVGSAGTFRFAIRCPGVTEVRPGTYVFNDRSQIAQGACDAGRPRRVRGRDRRRAARRPTGSSSTPGRRCSRPTGCSSPTRRPPSAGCGATTTGTSSA